MGVMGQLLSVGGSHFLVASSAVFLIRSLSTTTTTTTAANNQHPLKKKFLYRIRNCKTSFSLSPASVSIILLGLYIIIYPPPHTLPTESYIYIYIVYTLEFDVST